MKKLILLALFAMPMAFAVIANDIPGKSDIVIQIQDLSPEQNVRIIELFEKDKKFQVTNTCSVLGLIVFSPLDENDISRLEAEAYVKFKVERLLSDKSLEVQNEISKGQVNQLCREKVSSMQTGE